VDEDRSKFAASSRPVPAPYRALLVLPLAYGVCIYLTGVASTLREPDQALSYYLVNTALFLAPGAVYGAAGALFLVRWQRPLAWLVLLGCGSVLIVAFIVVNLRMGVEASFIGRVGFLLEPLLLPLYLTAFAAVEVHGSRARRAAHLAGSQGHKAGAHVQL
jgi:hypothetical protein